MNEMGIVKGKELTEIMLENILNLTRNYLTDNNIKNVVVGLSGGIDSTLAAFIMMVTMKSTSDINLIGRVLPIVTNKSSETNIGKSVGKYICSEYKVKDLSMLYRLVASIVAPAAFFNLNRSKRHKVMLGNIKARLRMIYLYNLARKYNGIVLSTDNYTEYLLGFWTLHGDVGDFGPIQNLWKTEVYAIANIITQYLERSNYNVKLASKMAKVLRNAMEAVPTDGLGITRSDVEQFEANDYTQVDEALERMIIKGGRPKTKIDRAIYDRHHATHFKRENPFNIKRKDIISY